MISRDELRKIAEAKGFSPENCEKDYLIELILFIIYSEFGNALIFKGGTALYKFFNLNRFSEDLDFTLNKKNFDFDRLVKKILSSLDSLGVRGKVKEFSRYKNEVNVKFNFIGPEYRGSKESMAFVSLNTSLRERAFGFKTEKIIPSYKEIPSFDVFVLSPEEILAEKMRTILSRNKPRDVYDLWFLLKRGAKIDLGLINKKLKLIGKKFSKKEFFEKIEEKRGLWESDLSQMIIGDLPDFDAVKKEIVKKFNQTLPA